MKETESYLCSEARRLEREARDAMEDAHRKAQAEAQHLKRFALTKNQILHNRNYFVNHNYYFPKQRASVAWES